MLLASQKVVEIIAECNMICQEPVCELKRNKILYRSAQQIDNTDNYIKTVKHFIELLY